MACLKAWYSCKMTGVMEARVSAKGRVWGGMMGDVLLRPGKKKRVGEGRGWTRVLHSADFIIVAFIARGRRPRF